MNKLSFPKAIGILSMAFIFLFGSYVCQAQAFYANGGVINDFNEEFNRDIFPIEVVGLTNQKMDTSFGLLSVCININHTKISDLKIQLMSPDGTTIWLTNRNGGNNGQDYQNTCFTPKGFSGYIHEAKAPFVGEYTPDSRMEYINNGQSPNGFWYLIIEDLHKENIGKLNSVSLKFGKNPVFNTTSSCTVNNANACQCSYPQKDSLLLPDLVILPSFSVNQLQEYSYNDLQYPGQVRVAASIANIGEGPMEIKGSGKWYCGNTLVDSGTRCTNNELARQTILQVIYKKVNGKLVKIYKEAGTLYFDEKPGHRHYHVDNWIELRIVKKIRTKKRVVQKIIGKSNKVSYCLFDTGICFEDDNLCKINNVGYNVQNLKNYGLGSYTDCHSQSQGISVGGYDTYGMLYEGQAIQLPKNLPKGWYYLQIEVDPLHLYKESESSNNLFEKKIFLQKQ